MGCIVLLEDLITEMTNQKLEHFTTNGIQRSPRRYRLADVNEIVKRFSVNASNPIKKSWRGRQEASRGGQKINRRERPIYLFSWFCGFARESFLIAFFATGQVKNRISEDARILFKSNFRIGIYGLRTLCLKRNYELMINVL
jgi:hypothetical protein